MLDSIDRPRAPLAALLPLSSLLLVAAIWASPAAAQVPGHVPVWQDSFTPLRPDSQVGSCAHWIDENDRTFALICLGDAGLDVWDITNPYAPAFASHLDPVGSALQPGLGDVQVAGHYAYCAQQDGPLVIADLSDPYHLAVAATVPLAGAHALQITDGWLYVAGHRTAHDGLSIYRLADPLAPAFVSYYGPPGFDAHDVTVDGNLAFVSSIESGHTRILDLTDRAMPMPISEVAHGNASCAVYTAPGRARVIMTSELGVGGNAHIYDVTNPAAPVFLSSWQTDSTASIARAVVRHRYAFVAYHADYLRVVDLANPAAPVEIAVFDPLDPNTGSPLRQGCPAVDPVSMQLVIVADATPGAPGFFLVELPFIRDVSMNVTTTGVGDLHLVVGYVDPYSEIINAVSLVTDHALGSGPLFGLETDALTTILSPPNTPPFRVTMDGPSLYSFHVGGGIPAGLRADFRSFGWNHSIPCLSEVGRITF